MNWTELSIINHEAVELATNILENHGSNGVVIEDSDDLINQPEDKYGEIRFEKEDYPDKGVRLKAYFNEMTYDDKLRDCLINITFNSVVCRNALGCYFQFRAEEVHNSPSWETYAKADD